jgi:hypothetical protein
MNGFYGNNNFGGYGNPALGVSYGYNYQQPQQPRTPPYQPPYGGQQPQSQRPAQQPTQPYSFNNGRNHYQFGSNGGGSDQRPKKSSRGLKAVLIILAIAVVLAIFAGVAGTIGRRNSGGDTTTAGDPTSVTVPTSEEPGAADDTKPAESTSADSNSLNYQTGKSDTVLSAVEVAKKVRPSVVGVMSYRSGELDGEGSGVVMGKDSTGKYTYIITCAHVISEPGRTKGTSSSSQSLSKVSLAWTQSLPFSEPGF